MERLGCARFAGAAEDGVAEEVKSLAVAERRMTIARHFNAGSVVNDCKSRRDGRCFQIEIMGDVGDHAPYVQPSLRTRADIDDDPALKRRAIVGWSLWDGEVLGAQGLPEPPKKEWRKK
jgi:hypothetical protein